MQVFLKLILDALTAFLKWFASLSNQNDTTKPPEPRARSFQFSVQESFFTSSERTFYRMLSAKLLGKQYMVFAKVRLEDVLRVAEGEDKTSSRNRVKGMHLDFLIVHTGSFRPVVAIELDGSYHNSAKQQRHDQTKNEAFAVAGFPLVRVRVGQEFATVIDGIVAQHLKKPQVYQTVT
jgi:very-short-patch-repair endonuclease